jgi:hypothetical protein
VSVATETRQGSEELDFHTLIAQSLQNNQFDRALELWAACWDSGCRDPYKWVKMVDLFEPYGLAERIFPLFLNIALELGVKNIWVLVLLARIACAAGVYATCISLARKALFRGVTDQTKYHLLRCIYISNVKLGNPHDALHTFTEAFSLLPFSCAANLPIKFSEAADLCVDIGREDLARTLRKGELPTELDIDISAKPDSIVGIMDEAGGDLVELLSIPASTIECQVPLSLNGLFPVPTFFKRTYRPRVNVCQLADARIIGQLGSFVVFNNRGEVVKSLSNFSCNNIALRELHDLDVKTRASGGYRDVDDIAVIRDPFPSPNICHFLLDQVSRFSLLSSAGVDYRNIHLIGPEVSAKYQIEMLEELGIRRDHFLPTKDVWAYSCRRLYVPNNVASAYVHPAQLADDWALGFLRATFLADHKTSTKSSYEKVYVARRASMGRSIKNESELMALLESHGFRTVYSETLSFPEQADLFSRSSHVIGPHGAGLTNIVFCPKNAQILELFHPFYASDAYYYIARGLGLDYRLACDETANLMEYQPHMNYGRTDLVAPIECIRSWLELEGQSKITH